MTSVPSNALSKRVEIGSESVAPVAREKIDRKKIMVEGDTSSQQRVRKRSYHIQWRLGDHIGRSAGDDRHL